MRSKQNTVKRTSWYITYLSFFFLIRFVSVNKTYLNDKQEILLAIQRKRKNKFSSLLTTCTWKRCICVFVYFCSRWTARTEIPEIANVGEMKIFVVCVNAKLHLTGSDPWQQQTYLCWVLAIVYKENVSKTILVPLMPPFKRLSTNIRKAHL